MNGAAPTAASLRQGLSMSAMGVACPIFHHPDVHGDQPSDFIVVGAKPQRYLYSRLDNTCAEIMPGFFRNRATYLPPTLRDDGRAGRLKRRVSQTDARAAAVLVNELDAGGFQSPTERKIVRCLRRRSSVDRLHDGLPKQPQPKCVNPSSSFAFVDPSSSFHFRWG